MAAFCACCRDRRGITSMEYGILGAIIILALASVSEQYGVILLPLFERIATFAAAAGH